MSHYLTIEFSQHAMVERNWWTCDEASDAECRLHCTDDSCETWEFEDKDGATFCRHYDEHSCDPEGEGDRDCEEERLVSTKFGDCTLISWFMGLGPDECAAPNIAPKDYRAGKHAIDFVWDFDAYLWKYQDNEEETIK